MKLDLNVNHALKFVDDAEYKALLNEADSARRLLLSGKGAGNDFLGWLDIDTDVTALLADIRKTADKIKADSDVLVVIGIGGSYLGARAALEFVNSPNYNLLQKNTPEIYFAGTHMSADAINEILSIIGNRDFSVNVVSKSGTTMEPAIVFRIFRQRLEQKYGRIGAASRIYATTDRAKGALKELSDEKGYKTFVIPDDVGGRYSVFTPVGLLPLAVAGVDIFKLVTGYETAIGYCKAAAAENNPALIYAALRNGFYRHGKKVELFAHFDPAAHFLGEWWKQLFGESEGKDGKGLFPGAVNYTADLHSLGQYIQSGERILIETLLDIESEATTLEIPADEGCGDGIDFLAGKSLLWVNRSALAATEEAHHNGNVPTFVFTLKDKSAESFGLICGMFMFACAVSGYMLGVNPFDQPGVEEYKNNTFRILGKPGYEAITK